MITLRYSTVDEMKTDLASELHDLGEYELCEIYVGTHKFEVSGELINDLKCINGDDAVYEFVRSVALDYQ